MREWTVPDMSNSAGEFLSPPEGFCCAEQLQCYDMLADPFGYSLQDPDLQLLPYSPQPYVPVSLPLSFDSPSSSSPSSSSSSSQLCQPLYQFGPGCLEAPCGLGAETPHGALELPVGRRTRVGSAGKSRSLDELCVVCGDKASGYHYNALTCEGCKGFFRRSVTKNAVYHCKSGGGCEMDMYMRRKCQDCRLRKCRAVGMLAECLLTEVQCQSKRLRKGGRGRGVEEENPEEEERGAGRRRASSGSSSSSRLPAQTSSPGLSRDQMDMVDRMVLAHRSYREQDRTAGFSSLDWPCSEEEDGVPDVFSPRLQRLLQFARTLPGFDLLDFRDQRALLSVSWLEVTCLLSAQQFSLDPTTPCPALQLFSAFVPGWLRHRQLKDPFVGGVQASSGSSEDFLRPVLDFLHSVVELRVSEAEYALLTATTLLCSDRLSLQAAGCVDKMQELILELLSRVCAAGRGGPRRFGRLLGRLTELRTLHHNYLVLMREQRGD